jgi:hypothetical protein
MKKLILFLFLIFLSSCVHEVKFVRFSDGTTILGKYNEANREVEVTLPSGETLRGQYVSLTNATIGYGSLFYGANIGSMLTVGAGGSSNGYALLTGNKGTIMEIIYSYSEWTGHGFGIAKTNKGDEYRVMF